MTNNTPLIDFHKKHSARIVDFCGWNLPVQYKSIIDEHKAVRSGVGLFDVSHMGQIKISGENSLGYLNYVLTNNFSKLNDGDAKYSIFCYEDGTCVDDLIVYKVQDFEYMIVVNAANVDKDFERFESLAKDFDVEVKNISENYALLALQGPLSFDVVKDTLGFDLSNQKRFTLKALGELMFSRTGYTGSDGFEIFCAPDKAVELAEKLLKDDRVKLCGLGARDSLRLEAQYSLYGHEISDKITPVEANLTWAINFDKDFIGKEKLLEQKLQGVEKRIYFFRVNDKRTLRQGAKIYLEGEEVGEVVSGAWSPMMGCPIGSALLKNKDYSNKQLFAKVRASEVELQIVKGKFEI